MTWYNLFYYFRRWRQDGALSGHPGSKKAGIVRGPLSRSKGKLNLCICIACIRDLFSLPYYISVFCYLICMLKDKDYNLITLHMNKKFGRSRIVSFSYYTRYVFKNFHCLHCYMRIGIQNVVTSLISKLIILNKNKIPLHSVQF